MISWSLQNNFEKNLMKSMQPTVYTMGKFLLKVKKIKPTLKLQWTSFKNTEY